ncbi:hypothetical protein L1049_006685 [Liquidambar formosana]|uniref:Late embryogenesis abundant protein LEA-2 subgroup domain-containing protein n=1 Tax=Liquidambar formosana TaxID=63359 RepID=A0AAP0RFY4_LIQFO
MAEESEVSSLAPPRSYSRSDEELAWHMPNASRHKKSNKCLVYILAGIVIQSIILLSFASVVLRVTTPAVKLRWVAVKNLKYDSTTPSSSLNATLIAEVTVKNRNFGRFEFENSTASFTYGDMKLGDMKIGTGRVKARETNRVNVTAEVRSNGLPDNMNLSSDIGSGTLELRSYAKLSGRVLVMKIVKKRETPEMNCNMTLNLSRGEIQDLLCN